jgi:hypothetical protein
VGFSFAYEKKLNATCVSDIGQKKYILGEGSFLDGVVTGSIEHQFKTGCTLNL